MYGRYYYERTCLPNNMAFCQISLYEVFPGNLFIGHLVGEQKEKQSAGADGRHGGVTLLVAVAPAESRLCGVLEKLRKIGLLPFFGSGLWRRGCRFASTFRACFFGSRFGRGGLLFGSGSWFVLEELFEAFRRFVPSQSRPETLESIGHGQRRSLDWKLGISVLLSTDSLSE